MEGQCSTLAARIGAGWLLVAVAFLVPGAETVRIGTYNLDNYLLTPSGGRPSKSEASKAEVRASIKALRADVLALQEVGSMDALAELRGALQADGVGYAHWELTAGSDTNIHVAVLSRHPITARRPHTNDFFLLDGRRFRVSRGFSEVDIQVQPGYQIVLITAHLKSRREVDYADQAELREAEARVLREKITARLGALPGANLVVLGDFNDNRNSKTLRTVLGRGRGGLIDTRPAERYGHDPPDPNPRVDSRQVTWTHYYGQEDTYSRIDYILASQGLAREWVQGETYVLARPNWGVASDHRPLVATFVARDR